MLVDPGQTPRRSRGLGIGNGDPCVQFDAHYAGILLQLGQSAQRHLCGKTTDRMLINIEDLVLLGSGAFLACGVGYGDFAGVDTGSREHDDADGLVSEVGGGRVRGGRGGGGDGCQRHQERDHNQG